MPRISCVCLHFTAEILYPVNLSIRWVVFSPSRPWLWRFFADDFYLMIWIRVEIVSNATMPAFASGRFFIILSSFLFFAHAYKSECFSFSRKKTVTFVTTSASSLAIEKSKIYIDIEVLHKLTNWLAGWCMYDVRTCNIQYDRRTCSTMGRQIERAWSEMCILMCMDFRWTFQYRISVWVKIFSRLLKPPFDAE